MATARAEEAGVTALVSARWRAAGVRREILVVETAAESRLAAHYASIPPRRDSRPKTGSMNAMVSRLALECSYGSTFVSTKAVPRVFAVVALLHPPRLAAHIPRRESRWRQEL